MFTEDLQYEFSQPTGQYPIYANPQVPSVASNIVGVPSLSLSLRATKRAENPHRRVLSGYNTHQKLPWFLEMPARLMGAPHPTEVSPTMPQVPQVPGEVAVTPLFPMHSRRRYKCFHSVRQMTPLTVLYYSSDEHLQRAGWRSRRQLRCQPTEPDGDQFPRAASPAGWICCPKRRPGDVRCSLATPRHRARA